jgi:hypothetical protein
MGTSSDTPAPEAIAEDELVVIRHRLQGELNSIDGRFVSLASASGFVRSYR